MIAALWVWNYYANILYVQGVLEIAATYTPFILFLFLFVLICSTSLLIVLENWFQKRSGFHSASAGQIRRYHLPKKRSGAIQVLPMIILAVLGITTFIIVNKTIQDRQEIRSQAGYYGGQAASETAKAAAKSSSGGSSSGGSSGGSSSNAQINREQSSGAAATIQLRTEQAITAARKTAAEVAARVVELD